jgi:DUF177 domain-containing protein
MHQVVSKIPAQGVELSFTEAPDVLELAAPGARFVEPVAVAVALRKIGDSIGVTGEIFTKVMFECVRCLREFLSPLGISVDARFLPGRVELSPGEHAMPADQAENYYYGQDVILLDDLVRQELLLAIPINPQCKPDCRGLCSQCGQDLNLVNCQCPPPSDSQLSALRSLYKTS